MALKPTTNFDKFFPRYFYYYMDKSTKEKSAESAASTSNEFSESKQQQQQHTKKHKPLTHDEDVQLSAKVELLQEIEQHLDPQMGFPGWPPLMILMEEYKAAHENDQNSCDNEDDEDDLEDFEITFMKAKEGTAIPWDMLCLGEGWKHGGTERNWMQAVHSTTNKKDFFSWTHWWYGPPNTKEESIDTAISFMNNHMENGVVLHWALEKAEFVAWLMSANQKVEMDD
jgi:hypothetical protein